MTATDLHPAQQSDRSRQSLGVNEGQALEPGQLLTASANTNKKNAGSDVVWQGRRERVDKRCYGTVKVTGPRKRAKQAGTLPRERSSALTSFGSSRATFSA
jgi:hypothetical protein